MENYIINYHESDTMNRLILLEILKQIILLRLKENITLENYRRVIEKAPKIEIDDNLIAYKETEILYTLFQSVPYYQVNLFLDDLLLNLDQLKEEKQTTCLLEGIISSILPSLKARMSTELNAHIYELIKSFYQSNHLNDEKIIEQLQKNLYSPDHLTGWDIATFEQLYFFKEENLREKISRTNYYRKHKSEDLVVSSMIKYFSTIENAELFATAVNDLFSTPKVKDNKKLSPLGYLLLEQLSVLYKKFVKVSIENSKKKDEHQLSLQFFQ